MDPLVENYTFEPFSSKATPECYSTEYSCPGLIVTKSHLSYSGYYDNNNKFHPFNGGTYTIVGGDEWGHLAIQHFVVTNDTQENPVKIPGLENDMGIVSLKNQTYYFDTPNYTKSAYVNPVQTSFHVVFTLFPPGFRGGLPFHVVCKDQDNTIGLMPSLQITLMSCYTSLQTLHHVLQFQPCLALIQTPRQV